MRGIKSFDLLSIIDYYGEANVYQEHLDTFLNIAEELKLKGLNRGGANEEEMYKETKEPNASTKQSVQTFNIKPDPQMKTPNNDSKTTLISSNYPEGNIFEDHIITDKVVVIQKDDFSGKLEELDIKIKAMIGRGENMILKGSAMIKVYVCQVCGKEGASTTQIRDHIEANHIEVISIPCNSCQKAFRSRNAFRQHRCKMLPLV